MTTSVPCRAALRLSRRRIQSTRLHEGQTYHRRAPSPGRAKFPTKLSVRAVAASGSASPGTRPTSSPPRSAISAKYGKETVDHPPVPATGIVKQGAGSPAAAQRYLVWHLYTVRWRPAAGASTWNVQTEEHEFKDVQNTKYAIIWGSTPSRPDARRPLLHRRPRQGRQTRLHLALLRTELPPPSTNGAEESTDGALKSAQPSSAKRGLVDEQGHSPPPAPALRAHHPGSTSRPPSPPPPTASECLHGVLQARRRAGGRHLLLRQAAVARPSRTLKDGKTVSCATSTSYSSSRPARGVRSQDRLRDHRRAPGQANIERLAVEHAFGEAREHLVGHRHQSLVPRRSGRLLGDRAARPHRQHRRQRRRRRAPGRPVPDAPQLADYFFPPRKRASPTAIRRRCSTPPTWSTPWTETMANHSGGRSAGLEGRGNLLGEALRSEQPDAQQRSRADRTGRFARDRDEHDGAASPTSSCRWSAIRAVDITTTPAHPYIQLVQGVPLRGRGQDRHRDLLRGLQAARYRPHLQVQPSRAGGRSAAQDRRPQGQGHHAPRSG